MPAQTAQVVMSQPVRWISGALFNGYVVFIMAMPTYSGTAITKVSLKDSEPKLRVPVTTRIPIREGVLDAQTKIWRTDSLVPTNIAYDAKWYDDTGTLISNTSSFNGVVTTDPWVLSDLIVPVLTDPVAGV